MVQNPTSPDSAGGAVTRVDDGVVVSETESGFTSSAPPALVDVGEAMLAVPAALGPGFVYFGLGNLGVFGSDIRGSRTDLDASSHTTSQVRF